ncbi:hypothetical protein TeGR_g3287 [Tetraparma gracilis]|uniref:SET domain-containing protein n=1 Tax=Tetraparma gracilis TaxID=2962635 RepID=A0ABQ6N6E0_9STRA|nr:hypothetical protein TeGR_g3287 [Tetraparma gracilis]
MPPKIQKATPIPPTSNPSDPVRASAPVDGLSVSYWEVLDMGTGTLSETDASAALKRIALVLLAISVSVFFCFYEEVLVSVNSSSASSALGGPFQLPSAAADHAPVDARSALFLTWVNATSYACCNMTLPSSISIRTSPGIASPSSLSYFDTRTSGGSAPRSVYGDGRSVFEKLYSNIVLTSPLSYFPTNQKQLGKADSASLITSGGVRGLYYDAQDLSAQDLSAQDLSASPTPSVVIPKPLHITRTVALKSLYGAALRHLSPAVLANKEVGVTKGMTAYPVPPVPVIPGRITGSTAPPKNVPTNSKLSRALVLANLTSAFSILADEIILALFLARERYIGASSAFAPWIQMLQDVDETVDLGPVRERVRKMSMPVLNGQYFPTRDELKNAEKPPPSQCGWKFSPKVLEGFDTTGWEDEYMHTRAYAKTIAFNLAADYGWLITAPVPEGDIDGSGLDWFAELLVSKKERERMKIAAEKSAKSNVASFAHTEDKQQKYRIEDFNYNHNNKISDLIEWGLCIATSRAVSSSDREYVADAYFPPSKPASRMEDPSPEHVFMQQVEELIENEYRYIDGRAKNAEGSKTEAQRAAAAALGNVKFVPVLDFINHGGKGELSEEVGTGNFLVKIDEGVVERQGGEIIANYNIDAYSALDWYLTQGFVPQERARDFVLGKNIMDPKDSTRDYEEDQKSWDSLAHERDRSKAWHEIRA